MRPFRLGDTATARRVSVSVLAAALASCGAQKTDFSKNEGAVAWLAHHHGTVPRECISQLIEKDGTTVDINDKSIKKALADAMQIAGSTYAMSRASENLIVAREKVLQISREGVAEGHMVESGLIEPITKLNEAIFDARMSRVKLAGLDACDFTATDEAFGFKQRSDVSYYSIGR